MHSIVFNVTVCYSIFLRIFLAKIENIFIDKRIPFGARARSRTPLARFPEEVDLKTKKLFGLRFIAA